MLRYDSANKKVTQFVSEGLLLGLSNEGEYNDVRIELKQDDLLFIYTDGLIESRNRDGEQFGVPRIKGAILNAVTSNPEEELIRKFTEFTENKYEDDVSMIAIKKL
jgi:serine phosphatase RsbU (regulator of sigma subunit)